MLTIDCPKCGRHYTGNHLEDLLDIFDHIAKTGYCSDACQEEALSEEDTLSETEHPVAIGSPYDEEQKKFNYDQVLFIAN